MQSKSQWLPGTSWVFCSGEGQEQLMFLFSLLLQSTQAWPELHWQCFRSTKQIKLYGPPRSAVWVHYSKLNSKKKSATILLLLNNAAWHSFSFWKWDTYASSSWSYVRERLVNRGLPEKTTTNTQTTNLTNLQIIFAKVAL